MVAIETVHVVAKAHLDLGFTALASEVEAQYLAEWFPQAIATAAELRARGGPERLVWTTGSWVLFRALAAADAAGDVALVEAVARGDLAWHALPLTTHTELMDAPLVRSGLAFSQQLDARFARPPTAAAKLTDVPGHTRGLVPLLVEAGVSFLHIGVNPAWPVPDVPPVFRWRSPDGAEVVAAYQSGGYGGQVVVPGCPDVLAFLHAGDNGGPPTSSEVVAAHGELAARFPGAEVRASTLDAFARTLASSAAVPELPVVTAEIGDPWIFGAASDPQKVAAYRALLRWPGDRTSSVLGAESVTSDAGCTKNAGATDDDRFLVQRASPVTLGAPRTDQASVADHRLLLVAEHTWGLDQKTHLPDVTSWDRAGLAAIRSTDAGRRFEASWAEQRAYVTAAAEAQGAEADPFARPTPTTPALGLPTSTTAAPTATPTTPTTPAPTATPTTTEQRAPRRPAFGSGEVGGERSGVGAGGWEVEVGSDGALRHLVHRDSGRVLADADHPLGLLTYQSFDEADYERFFAQLTPEPHDVGWARLDNTKPGIGAAGAVSGRWAAQQTGSERQAGPDGGTDTFMVGLSFEGDVPGHLGAPPTAWLRWSFGPGRVDLDLGWADKPASRLPEALWCSFVPVVAKPERWTFEKLGQAVSPLDVVRHGGRSLHAVGEGGCHYGGPDGRLVLRSIDAPLVAPGAPNLLDADPPVPDLAGGLHVLLYDNCWGTNFPMWNEGPALFRFTLTT